MHALWKRSLAVAALGALAGVLCAGEAVPVESVAPASALGEVRAELKTVKGARQADEVRPGTGAVEMPKLHQVDEADPVPRRRAVPGRGERAEVAPKGDNWLLEGMAREKALAEKSGRSQRDPRDREPTTRARGGMVADNDRGGEGTPEGADETGLDGGAAREPTAIEALGEPVTAPEPAALPENPVANPLADFLGDWLSPNDHDLLRSTLGPAGSSGAGREGYGTEPIESANPVIAGMGARGRTDMDRGGGKPADNPFLAFLQPPDTGANAAAATTPPPTPPPKPLPPPVQLEPPPTRSRTPDFVRPLQDEKYYKPLKRF